MEVCRAICASQLPALFLHVLIDIQLDRAVLKIRHENVPAPIKGGRVSLDDPQTASKGCSDGRAGRKVASDNMTSDDD